MKQVINGYTPFVNFRDRLISTLMISSEEVNKVDMHRIKITIETRPIKGRKGKK